MTTVTVTSGQTYPVSSGETDIGDTVLFTLQAVGPHQDRPVVRRERAHAKRNH
jgi:hypothetical protein